MVNRVGVGNHVLCFSSKLFILCTHICFMLIVGLFLSRGIVLGWVVSI